jgi:hypothetical protein
MVEKLLCVAEEQDLKYSNAYNQESCAITQSSILSSIRDVYSGKYANIDSSHQYLIKKTLNRLCSMFQLPVLKHQYSQFMIQVCSSMCNYYYNCCPNLNMHGNQESFAVSLRHTLESLFSLQLYTRDEEKKIDINLLTFIWKVYINISLYIYQQSSMIDNVK